MRERYKGGSRTDVSAQKGSDDLPAAFEGNVHELHLLLLDDLLDDDVLSRGRTHCTVRQDSGILPGIRDEILEGMERRISLTNIAKLRTPN
jgi:hypothetical protein